MEGKALQLFVTTLVAALLANETQGGPLGDFPIKTFPRVLSDVRRIISEAREEIGETRSWFQAISSRLSNVMPKPQEQVRQNEDAIAKLRCQRYQLAFDRTATICVDVEFKGVFDDVAHLVTEGSIKWPNKDEVLERCAEESGKQGGWIVQDVTDTSREGPGFAAKEGSGQTQDVEIDPEQVFGQGIEGKISEAKIPKRREVSDVENITKTASEIEGEIIEDPETQNPLENVSMIKIEEETKIFINCLQRRINILTSTFPMINLNEHTRNKRGSSRKGPFPRIIISLPF